MLATSPSPLLPFCVRVLRERGEIVVAPAGELDIASADVLQREFCELHLTRADRVVLDLRGVDFIDSTGLRLLISLRNSAKRGGYGLIVAPGPARVQRVFELTGTRGLFDWRA